MVTKRVAVSSGGKVLELLLAVAESGRALTVSELTELLGLPRSTVYRYLKVLRSHGLLWSIGGGRYAIGPRAMQLARSFEETVSLATVCRPIMEQLAHETQETVALVVPVGEQAVCIETVESRQPLRYSFQRGVARSLLRGASAKAMLPYLPHAVVERAMVNAGLNEGARAALWAEIRQIARQGYAESEGEVDRGVWAVGAPVVGAHGELLGALSVIVPVVRLTARRRAELVERVCVAAQRISMRALQETKAER